MRNKLPKISNPAHQPMHHIQYKLPVVVPRRVHPEFFTFKNLRCEHGCFAEDDHPPFAMN